MPDEAQVTRIDFEGPRIAIYAKNPSILLEHTSLISDIVSAIHKRIVIRSDPSARASEQETEELIKRLVPPQAQIKSIKFDPVTGGVVVEAERPRLVLGEDLSTLHEVLKKTGWRIRAFRAPTMPSTIVGQLREYLYTHAKQRESVLRAIGERIFRDRVFGDAEVRVTTLGGFRQVGRSAILVQTREGSILLDCGINPGTTNPPEAYPRIDQIDLEELEAVVITHAHLDHCGFLPFLFKYGYDGPVYCSEPTLNLMALLQLDYLDVLANRGIPPPYHQRDIRKAIAHAIPLPYGLVTDVAPDVKLTLHNAGHILGSAIVHLHIGEGLYNIVYTGDYKFMPTMLLAPSHTSFPRVETLITETTYGAPQDVMPSRAEAEETLVNIVNQTLKRRGKVLIPVLAVGRSQEIMLILDKNLRAGSIEEVPIFIEGMVSEVTAIHTAFPEYLTRRLRTQILEEGIDPFKSEYFVTVRNASERPSIIEGGPCIILATSGMLEGGPVLDYFKHLAPSEENTIIFVSYQIEGTLGRQVLEGESPVPILDIETGRIEHVEVKAQAEVAQGFSGHSDRRQLIAYINKVTPRPRSIITCHGEGAKCTGMANFIQRAFKFDACAPSILETLRLR